MRVANYYQVGGWVYSTRRSAEERARFTHEEVRRIRRQEEDRNQPVEMNWVHAKVAA